MAEHMTPEEFRRAGHAVVDWIADYWTDARAAPGDLAGRRPARWPPRCRPARPSEGEPVDAVLADLDA